MRPARKLKVKEAKATKEWRPGQVAEIEVTLDETVGLMAGDKLLVRFDPIHRRFKGFYIVDAKE